MEAELLSLESLCDLEGAVATFSGKARDLLDALRAELRHREALLNEREDAARQEVAYWRSAVEGAEESEDLESYLSELSAARERLENVSRWQARIGEERTRFTVEAARFDRLLDQAVPACRGDLKAKIADLRSYGSIQLDLRDGASSAAAVGAAAEGPLSSVSPAVEIPVGPPAKLTDLSLPDGFVWVPLAQVSQARLPSFSAGVANKGVSYEAMVSGLRRFAGEVLPRISLDPNGLGFDAFRALDEAAGQDYEHGLQRLYEGFFGKDFIYLVRGEDQEKFAITNGGHRIRVALDLGWDAIPARVKDLQE